MHYGPNNRAGSRTGPPWAIPNAVCALFLVALLCLPGGVARAESAALVLDAGSGDILYSYRAASPHHPASLTKIMTLYMTFEALRDGRLKPGQRLKISRRAANQRPSRLGLRRGKKIRLEDAILALVTKSANDASVVIAEAIAGTEAAFAKRMTDRAHALGMTGTVFRNASGLHHPEQVTTARDMAKLAMALIRDFPERYKLFSTKRFVWHGRRHRNHNEMLSSYEGADGIKTGYIRQSGFNLVASAQRDGRRVIGVVLGGQNSELRNWAMEKLLDYGFLRLGGDRTRQAGYPELPYLANPAGEAALELALDVAGTQPRNGRTARFAKTAPIPAAAPPLKRARSSGFGPKWSIQVGAYRQAPAAEEAAALAADRIPALLRKARVLVIPVTRNGQRMYRARLTGLSESGARDSCRQLARHRIPCLAIGDRGEFRTSSLLR